MRKRINLILICIVCIFILTTNVTVYAETNPTLTNFKKTAQGDVNTFTDVKQSDWFYNSVITAYSYGIINGIGNNQFNPQGNLTYAEALTIAARIHAIYKYGNDADEAINKHKQSGVEWYDVYVRYCKFESLIGSEFDNSLMKPITRAQMVFAWSRILLDSDMEMQNEVQFLPDITSDTPYQNEIIRFYQAGIIQGTDSIGTFKPNNNITRAEAAAIFMNLIIKSNRANEKSYLQDEKI